MKEVSFHPLNARDVPDGVESSAISIGEGGQPCSSFMEFIDGWRSVWRFATTTAWRAGRRGGQCRYGRSTWGTFFGSRSCQRDFGNAGFARCAAAIHVTAKTRRGFKWAGLFILVLVAFIFWADSPEPDAVAVFWTGRIAAPVGAALLLWHLLRTPKEPTLKARLATIPHAANTVCPFCGAQLLVLGSQCSCPACGVVRS
jgi:hypothetical protein